VASSRCENQEASLACKCPGKTTFVQAIHASHPQKGHMEIPEDSPPRASAWYRRVDVWTLMFVVFGGIGHYYLVDRPATRNIEVNRRLAEQNLDASQDARTLLKANIEESKAHTTLMGTNIQESRTNTQFLKRRVEQLDSPETKSSEKAVLAKQQVDEARLIDDLLESLVPNVQIQADPKLARNGNTIEVTWRVKNLGDHTVIVSAPTFRVARVIDRTSAHVDFSVDSDFKVSGCALGHVRPSQTLTCGLVVAFRPEIDLGDKLYSTSQFEMIGQLDPNSETHKVLRRHYDETVLQRKLSFSSRVTVEIGLK
jgi:hypothetical protein